MQVVKKTVVYILVGLLLTLVLMPKQELYYKLEQELLKSDIVISDETISNGWFTLKLKNASVYVKGIKVATIEEIDIFTIFIYTGATLQKVKLDDSLESIFFREIQKVNLSCGILHPLQAKLSLNGDFGEAWGSADFETKRLLVNFTEIDKLGGLKRQFKKVEEGWQYETSF